MKKERTFKERMILHYHINRRSGLLRFIFINFLKLLGVLALIVLLIIGLNQLVLHYLGMGVEVWFNNTIQHIDYKYVLMMFFASESILGWIPPDLFIVWSKASMTKMVYLNVGILATISYLGGMVSYYLGVLIRRFPKVNKYVERKFENNFQLVNRWGGIVVLMAAMFPLPYATISTVAGIVRYPFGKYLLYGSTRFIRFYLYAFWIFWGLEQLA